MVNQRSKHFYKNEAAFMKSVCKHHFMTGLRKFVFASLSLLAKFLLTDALLLYRLCGFLYLRLYIVFCGAAYVFFLNC